MAIVQSTCGSKRRQVLDLLRTDEGWLMDDHDIAKHLHCSPGTVARGRVQVMTEPAEVAPGHEAFVPRDDRERVLHLQKLQEMKTDAEEAMGEARIEYLAWKERAARLSRLHREAHWVGPDGDGVGRDRDEDGDRDRPLLDRAEMEVRDGGQNPMRMRA